MVPHEGPVASGHRSSLGPSSPRGTLGPCGQSCLGCCRAWVPASPRLSGGERMVPVQSRELHLPVNTFLLCPPAGPPVSAECASLPGCKAVSPLSPHKVLLIPQPPSLACQTRLDYNLSAQKNGRGSCPPSLLSVRAAALGQGPGLPEHLITQLAGPRGQAPFRVGAAPPTHAAPHPRSTQPSMQSAGSSRDTRLVAGTGPCPGRRAQPQMWPLTRHSALPAEGQRIDKGQRVLTSLVSSSEWELAQPKQLQPLGNSGLRSGAALGTRGLGGCVCWKRVFGCAMEWQLSPSPAGGLC